MADFRRQLDERTGTMTRHVAIIGGGFFGTMLAIHLMHRGLQATIIKRRPAAGVGLAYGDADPVHLLNVPAANMSAFPDRPDHFVRWLEANGRADSAEAFIPRRVFGDYIRDLLAEAKARFPGRLAIVRDRAVDLQIGCAGVSLTRASGSAIEADVAVLAVGNLPPGAPAGLDPAAFEKDSYIGDPWQHDPAAGLLPDDRVLILGTGLSMIDMVLRLRLEGFTGQITALSRRGLMPHCHASQSPYQPLDHFPPAELSLLVKRVRARSAAIGWRNAVDELRLFTQALWSGADPVRRARFMRHLRPWWDIHRHRIAPRVADEIDGLLKERSLTIFAARVATLSQHGDMIEVVFQRRGRRAPETARFRRVINCMGPLSDVRRADEPILRRLADRGLIRADGLGLGIDVDRHSRTFDCHGGSSDSLFAIGPMSRGAFWEIIAVPDIRVQAAQVAQRLDLNDGYTDGRAPDAGSTIGGGLNRSADDIPHLR